MVQWSDSFENESDGNDVPSGWTELNGADGLVANESSYDGSISYNLSAIDSLSHSQGADEFTPGFQTSTFSAGGYTTVRWAYREVSNGQGGVGCWATDSDGNISFAVGTTNPDVVYRDGGTEVQLASGNYEVWYPVEVTIDWGNSTYSVDWNNGGATATGIAFENSAASEITTLHVGAFGSDMNENLDNWQDDFYLGGALEAPSSLSTSQTQTGGETYSTWTDNSSQETGFNIYRSTSSGSSLSDYTLVDSVGADVAEYRDTGLSEDQTYYYRVTAATDATESQPSNEGSATTSVNAPSNIQQSIDSPTAATITFQDNSSVEAHHRLEKSVDGGAWAYVTDIPAGTTSYQATISKSADTFQWRLRAETSGGNKSTWATSATVSTNGSGLTSTVVSGTEVDLSWDSNRDADEYHVYRAEASSTSLSDYTRIATPTAGTTTYSDTRLENGEEYHWRVAPVYGGAEDEPSGDDVAITQLPAPTLDSLDASTEDQITVNYTLADNSTDGTVEICRSADGTLGSNIATISDLSQTSYTDTGIDDGEQYHYTVRRRTDHMSADSSQSSATTVLPAPALHSVSVSGDQFDLAITDNSDNEDKFVIHVAHDGGTWVEDKTVAAGTTSMSTTSLLDGEQYDVRVGARTEDAVSWSAAQTATTVLPDVSAPSLDNGIEDEIGVSWGDVIDNGDYRVEYRESSASTWTAHTTVSQSTTSTTITGLEDGEEYDVRLRAETEHVTGAWTATKSIVTNFPSPKNPSASLSSTNPRTAIDYSFTDNADNEDGVRVERQRKFDYGWGPWQVVEDLAPNTTSGTDDTCSPGNTYRYRFEAYTEDASNTSGATNSVTTDATSETREATGASGWTVEIEHPSGQTLRPRLLDDPRFTPALNDYPRVEIPVPRDEKWQAQAFEEASLSVWQDGQILPIDQLINVRMEEGRTVLEGRGGSELQDRVQAEYDDTPAHIAADNLITNQTSYTANVDNPASKTKGDTQMQSADTDSEFDSVISRTASDPYQNVNGGVEAYQSCWPIQSVDGSYTGDYYQDSTHFSSNAYDDKGEAIRLRGEGDYVEVTFTPDYDIPSSNIFVRLGNPNKIIDDGHAISVQIDGTEVFGTVKGFGLTNNMTWLDGSYSTTLSAGTQYTVRIGIVEKGTATDDVYVDILGAADDRFTYNYDNTIDSNYALAGPETYPDGAEVVFDGVETAYQVTGGKITADYNRVSGNQAVAIRNDTAGSWSSSSNTESFSTPFESVGTAIQWRGTVGRDGSRSGVTPTQGFQSQRIESFTLYADLEDTPILDGQKHDGELRKVLNQIADYGNFIWELQRNQNGWRVEWTEPGQRTATGDDSLISYSVTKKSGSQYDKAVIKGAAQPVQSEEFSAPSFDTWVNLAKSGFVPGTDIVRNPSTGTVYTVQEDYKLDRQNGQIKLVSGSNGGSTSTDTTYEIDYKFKTEGSYTASSAGSDPNTVVRTVSGLTTNQACKNAALYLVQRVQEPLWEATVTVPKTEASRSLVDDLLLEDLPTQGERMEVQEIEQTPKQVMLKLGSRQSLGETINDLQSRLSSVSDRV
ncbi:fibronectin type III domain-containing protein [Halorussus sp. MSC15.2]|uniref:fibronectin type III domain-containing protein n=1 Tax=Halorussus sp. MSC15.2 TaxID=2283638 RepID=UPI0013D381AA|nr:fibronectin type III domain-containing protein [Halorussus sp. MSC15.2]NEU57097.1 fibronectin type III domain-containing protein [Halorussus sp. MSC15.2]